MTRPQTSLFLVALLIGCSQQADVTQSSASPAEADADHAEDNGQADGESDGAAARQKWLVEYQRMIEFLELSEEEQAQLEAAFAARQTEYDAWMAEHGARLESLEKKMMAAAKSRDLSGVREAKGKAVPLRDALRELLDRHQDAVTQALSAEDQIAWAAGRLTERLLALMSPLSLTDAQISQIRDQAVVASQKSASEPNPSAAGFVALEKAVESAVLTAEQRETYDVEKKKHPMRSLN